jgi:hypothetical protein
VNTVASIESVKRQVEECIEALKNGELTEENLRSVAEGVGALNDKRQDLLYVQAGSTSPGAGIHGMLLVQDGKIIEPEVDNWPYNSVIEAIRDGWRIIEFPNMALMVDESRTYGLGCEFVLEKWG